MRLGEDKKSVGFPTVPDHSGGCFCTLTRPVIACPNVHSPVKPKYAFLAFRLLPTGTKLESFLLPVCFLNVYVSKCELPTGWLCPFLEA